MTLLAAAVLPFLFAPVRVVAWRLAWEDRLFRNAQFWTRRVL